MRAAATCRSGCSTRCSRRRQSRRSCRRPCWRSSSDSTRLSSRSCTVSAISVHASRMADIAMAPDDVTTRHRRDTVGGRPLSQAELTSILRNWIGGKLGSMALYLGGLFAHLAGDAANSNFVWHLPLHAQRSERQLIPPAARGVRPCRMAPKRRRRAFDLRFDVASHLYPRRTRLEQNHASNCCNPMLSAVMMPLGVHMQNDLRLPSVT